MSAYALPRIAAPARSKAARPTARLRWNPWGDFIRWASGKSNNLAKSIADAVYSATAYTAPVNMFWALWTATLSASSTGSTAGEASYTGYARVSQTNNATNFPAATGTTSATKNNATAVTWGQNTGGASQTVISAATATLTSAGNIVHWGDITSTVININDTPQIAINGFTLTES